MKIFRSVLILCSSILLTTSVASAGDCKKAFVNTGFGTYYANCPFQGDIYPFCIVTPIEGTLNGTWVFFIPSWFNYRDIFPDDLPQPFHPGYQTGWGVSSFFTNKGELWTRDAWTADFAHVPSFDFFTQSSEVIGGTGVYDGAEGYLGFIGGESEGIFRGMVCTE